MFSSSGAAHFSICPSFAAHITMAVSIRLPLFGEIEEHVAWKYVGWVGIAVTYVYLAASLVFHW